MEKIQALSEISRIKYKGMIAFFSLENINLISSLSCFIENKVNSSEGERQLERYIKVLEIIKKQQGKNVYLRYCTKYHDFKDNTSNIDFFQFRWRDVYRYFDNTNKDNGNKIIEEFLRFLRSKGMGNAGDFNYEDLIVMKEMNETIKKMNECLNSVKPKLIECFGQPYEHDYERLKQICKWNQYVMWKDNIIGDSGYSEITAGFGFNDKIGFGNKEEGNQVPYLKAFIWIEADNSEYETIKKLYSKNLEEVFDCYDYDKDGIYYAFEEPLSLFVSERNQEEAICEWFNDKINRINELKNYIKIKWNS